MECESSHLNSSNSFAKSSARTSLVQRCNCIVDCKQRKISSASESQENQILNANSSFFNFKPRRIFLLMPALVRRDRWSVSSDFMFVVLLTLLLLSAGVVSPTHGAGRKKESSRQHGLHKSRGHHERPKTYLNEFAVNLKRSGEEEATKLALKYGFINKGPIGTLEGWYLFESKRISKRSVQFRERYFASAQRLKMDKFVNIVERQKVLARYKRIPTFFHSRREGSPNDPAWRSMWYMHCGGINNTLCPTSMKITSAWRAGFFGENVVVTILDDGIEYKHPDLETNYDKDASYDINGSDVDPTPRYDHSNENKHGTRCAGVVAAVKDNKICSVGIAYKAKIGGIRMLDGEVTDKVEARSLGHNPQHIDIYSASWGPDDDGSTVEGPGYLAKAAFKDGAKRGRGGKGSIFVWASGNGGHNHDTCSCDGYINSIYTIGVSSVSQFGQRPWYLESCASTLATTYSSGEVDEGKIITTDLRSSCTYQHTGTSASAPMAAGVIALMLDANKNLTWRDVQHVIVRTSNPRGLQAGDWVVNGAGFNVSHVFGFGLMDAAKLTHIARSWKTVGEQKQCLTTPSRVANPILSRDPLFLHVETRACTGKANEINFLEHVILRISLTHSRRGDLQIFLTSPAGTRSNVLERRNNDRSNAGFDEWDFMTTHHWGENPEGQWTLEIVDIPFRMRYRDSSHINELRRWQLIFYGTTENPQPNFYENSCDAFPQDHCHPECDGCCGPSAMECRSCQHVSTYNGTCIPRCPLSHFSNLRTNMCQTCSKSCRECSGSSADNCTACHHGYAMVNGSCIKTCADGEFLNPATENCMACDPLCLTCEEHRVKCTSCRNGFRHRQHTCYPSCQSGTYLYHDRCLPCDRSCLECTASSNSHCITCNRRYVSHKNRCIESCPKRYYQDTRDNTCALCHKTCKTCLGPNPAHCLSCNTDFVLRDGQCRRTCRDDHANSYSCILIIQNKWCGIPLFRSFCCHACFLFESGVLFVPPKEEYDDDYDYSNGENYTVDYPYESADENDKYLIESSQESHLKDSDYNPQSNKVIVEHRDGEGNNRGSVVNINSERDEIATSNDEAVDDLNRRDNKGYGSEGNPDNATSVPNGQNSSEK